MPCWPPGRDVCVVLATQCTLKCTCRILIEQQDPQNLQKWRLCEIKLQQERLLVQQLETEAAHMHLAGEAGHIECSIRPFRVHRYCSAPAQDRLRQPLGLEHLSQLQDNLCMGVSDAIQLGY